MAQDEFSGGVVVSDFDGPWPMWTKRAMARLLQMWFPTTRTEEWEECFKAQEPLEEAMQLLGDGRILGHAMKVARWVQEEINPQNPQHADLPVKEVSQSARQTLEMIAKELSSLPQQPMEQAQAFFTKFTRAMEKELGLRDQDKRAFRVYLLLVILWPHVQTFRGRSLKELYAWLRPYLGPIICQEGEDEIDAEERHYKWFENLCERHLGLSLRQRGRPPGTQGKK